MVRMVEIAGGIRLLIGIGSENVLRWIMSNDDARAVFANEPYNGSTRILVVSEVSVTEAEKLDGFDSQYLTGHTLLLFAREHKLVLIYIGNFAAFSAVSHDSSSVLFPVFLP